MRARPGPPLGNWRLRDVSLLMLTDPQRYLFRMDLQRWLGSAVEAIGEWQGGVGAVEAAPPPRLRGERVARALRPPGRPPRGDHPLFHPSPPRPERQTPPPP